MTTAILVALAWFLGPLAVLALAVVIVRWLEARGRDPLGPILAEDEALECLRERYQDPLEALWGLPERVPNHERLA